MYVLQTISFHHVFVEYFTTHTLTSAVSGRRRLYKNMNKIVELCVLTLWRSHHSSNVYLYCAEEIAYVERILIFTVVEYVSKYGFPRLLFSLRCDRLPLPFKISKWLSVVSRGSM